MRVLLSFLVALSCFGQSTFNTLYVKGVPGSAGVGHTYYFDPTNTYNVNVSARTGMTANIPWHWPNLADSAGQCLVSGGGGNWNPGSCLGAPPITLSGTSSSPILTLTNLGSGPDLVTTGLKSIFSSGTSGTPVIQFDRPNTSTSGFFQYTVAGSSTGAGAWETGPFSNNHFQIFYPSASLAVFDSDTSGNVTVPASLTAGNAVIVTGASGTNRLLEWTSGSSLRWQWRADSSPESGSDAGTNLKLMSFNDSGVNNFTPITVTRSTGAVTISNNSAASPSLTVTNSAGSPGVDIKTGGDLTIFSAGRAGGVVQIDRAAATNLAQLQFTVGGNNGTTGSWLMGTNSGDMNFIYGASSTNLFQLDTSGNETIPGSVFAGSALSLDSAAGTNRILEFSTGTPGIGGSASLRWQIRADNSPETGSNAGSNLKIQNYTDGGVSFGPTPITITRSSGLVTFGNDVSFGGNLAGTHAQNLGTGDSVSFGGLTVSSFATLNGTLGGTHAQNLGTSDNPTFNTLTITSTMGSGSYTSTGTVTGVNFNANGGVYRSSGTVIVDASRNASFVGLSFSGSLSGTHGQNIGTGDSPTFSGLTLTGGLTLASAGIGPAGWNYMTFGGGTWAASTYYASTTAGVGCPAGTVSLATFAVSGGIVIHC